jgi:hypothetical protein
MQFLRYNIGNSTWAQYALQRISASSTSNCINQYNVVVYTSSFQFWKKTDQYYLNMIRLELHLWVDKYVWVNVKLVTIRFNYSASNKHLFEILNNMDMFCI